MKGQDNYCVSGARYLGITRNGAYGTHVLVPHPRYLVDTGDLDPSFASTLSCSALTVFSAVAKLSAAGSKDWVAVVGCGGLGLVAFSILKAKGIENLIACDIDDAKLDAATRLGARKTLNTRDATASASLQTATDGNLAGTLDFVGMPSTAALALGALQKGGQYVLCGLYGGELRHPLPPIAQRAIFDQRVFRWHPFRTAAGRGFGEGRKDQAAANRSSARKCRSSIARRAQVLERSSAKSSSISWAKRQVRHYLSDDRSKELLKRAKGAMKSCIAEV